MLIYGVWTLIPTESYWALMQKSSFLLLLNTHCTIAELNTIFSISEDLPLLACITMKIHGTRLSVIKQFRCAKVHQNQIMYQRHFCSHSAARYNIGDENLQHSCLLSLVYDYYGLQRCNVATWPDVVKINACSNSAMA